MLQPHNHCQRNKFSPGDIDDELLFIISLAPISVELPSQKVHHKRMMGDPAPAVESGRKRTTVESSRVALRLSKETSS